MAPKTLLCLMALVLLLSTEVISSPENWCIQNCDGEKGYCRVEAKKHQKRECERACETCCLKYSCVPPYPGAEGNKCPVWDTATNKHGHTATCPKP